MKTAVAGALGECPHVAGVLGFLRLAEAAGWCAGARVLQSPSLLREVENIVREANGLPLLPAIASERLERVEQIII